MEMPGDEPEIKGSQVYGENGASPSASLKMAASCPTLTGEVPPASYWRPLAIHAARFRALSAATARAASAVTCLPVIRVGAWVDSSWNARLLPLPMRPLVLREHFLAC